MIFKDLALQVGYYSLPETVTWHKIQLCLFVSHYWKCWFRFCLRPHKFAFFPPRETTCMSQHPVICCSYAVVFFCLLICCSLIVSLSLVNQLCFVNHLCFCEPLWKVINACRFSMRFYHDIGRVLSSFMLVISSSTPESV